MNEKKVIEAKARLFELMKPFIDENKCINLSGFRKACPQKYAILPHYFGSVDKALAELNLIKVTFIDRINTNRDFKRDEVNIHDCSIYQGLVSQLLVEKYAPLQESLYFLVNKANYKIINRL